jgi:hypothetical protein
VKAQIKSNRAAVKLAREQKEALLAGMKAPTSTEFTQVMQQTFEKAGLDRYANASSLMSTEISNDVSVVIVCHET